MFAKTWLPRAEFPCRSCSRADSELLVSDNQLRSYHLHLCPNFIVLSL
jgi:hypothetical protein